MKGTKGILEAIRQHDKLTINVSANGNQVLPPEVLKKLLKPHRTSCYFFLFVDSGTSMHKIDFQNLTVLDGQLLFVLPHQIHTPPPKKDNIKYFKLSFDEHCLALLPQQYSFLINPLNAQIIRFDHTAKQRVKAVFDILNHLLHSGKEQKDPEIILAHLNALLTEFNHAYFKNMQQNDNSNAKLSKYIAFKRTVEAHLTEQPSINTIAEKLAVTTSGLYSIVKLFSGLSPKEFFTNRLMLEAQRKLHYSNLSVKDLAYELGFNDPDYFSRLFKKSIGKSVRKYLADLQDLSVN